MPCKVVRSSGNLISVRITGELKKTELDQMQAVVTEFMNLTKGVVFLKRHCMIACCIGCLQFIGCGAGGAGQGRAETDHNSFQPGASVTRSRCCVSYQKKIITEKNIEMQKRDC